MTTVDIKRLVTSHYIRYWGVPKDIQRRAPINGIDLALLTFFDKDGGGVWLATNGISTHDWIGKGGRVFGMELCVYLKSAAAIDRGAWLLEMLFGYMLRHDCPLHVWETVAGGDLPKNGVPFDDVLILEPYDSDTGLGGQTTGWPKPFLLNQAVGLYASETELAISSGGKSVFDLLVKNNADERLPIDVARLAIL